MAKERLYTRQIQQKGRVDISDEDWESLGLVHGDKVLIAVFEERIEIRPAKPDQLR